jgi:ATPase subunit of ABC transporter with duplicated ATPase domains
MVSIGLLEEALAEYAGALLLVSHDERFLRALTGLRWTIVRRVEDSALSVSAVQE